MIRNDNPDKGTEGTAGVESQAGYVAEIRNDNPDKGTEGESTKILPLYNSID